MGFLKSLWCALVDKVVATGLVSPGLNRVGRAGGCGVESGFSVRI